MVYFNLTIRTSMHGEPWTKGHVMDFRAETYGELLDEFHRFTPAGTEIDDFSCELYTFGTTDLDKCGSLLSVFHRFNGEWRITK